MLAMMTQHRTELLSSVNDEGVVARTVAAEVEAVSKPKEQKSQKARKHNSLPITSIATSLVYVATTATVAIGALHAVNAEAVAIEAVEVEDAVTIPGKRRGQQSRKQKSLLVTRKSSNLTKSNLILSNTTKVTSAKTLQICSTMTKLLTSV